MSIHIRRTDYIGNPLHDNICTLEYYKSATYLIKKNIKDPIFFVFSDDIEWCTKNLFINDAIFIEGNINKNSYKDMQLMTACKCNIIANSSFSWWAAWLNSYEKKIVITPNRMNNESINFKDAFPASWLIIPIQ